MSETWKQWEGQIVNGQFPLLAYLGGSRHSAVFMTKRKVAPERAAIKLVRADENGAESQLQRWKKSSELNHPNLVRIFECGRCELEDTPLLYVVMEVAEEDLSQILPERRLTADEVRQMLPPVLDALEHLHGQSLVHGRVRPSNIQASGDQVKVSADSVRVSGERVPAPDVWSANDPPESSSDRLTSAADVWSLAVTIVQVLTQQRPMWHPSDPASPSLPETTPEPFREIARRCLQSDPAQRSTVVDIRAALQPKTSRPASVPVKATPLTSGVAAKKSTPWKWAAGLAGAALVIGIIVMAGTRHRDSRDSVEQSQAEQAVKESRVPEPSAVPSESKPSPTHAKKASAHVSPGQPVQERGGRGKGAVLHQVMPQVSASARRTIAGTIKVGVRVDVDASGNVTAARLVSPGPSKYFSRLSLEAARDWKFTPPQPQGQALPSQWNLRFGFRRGGTDVVSTQTSP